MTTSRTVTAKAASGTLTLSELRAFLAELDHAGAGEDTPVSGTMRFGGGVKSLKAVAERSPEPAASQGEQR
jgi:hypothetical protein